MKLPFKILYLFIGLSMFCSCRIEHPMFFDINKQELISCDKKRIKQIIVSSEEEKVAIYWEDTLKEAPRKLDFKNIPKGYQLHRGGLISDIPLKMKASAKYLVEKWGSGGVSFYLYIWTDSNGNIYKTSHPECGLESLDFE